MDDPKNDQSEYQPPFSRVLFGWIALILFIPGFAFGFWAFCELEAPWRFVVPTAILLILGFMHQTVSETVVYTTLMAALMFAVAQGWPMVKQAADKARQEHEMKEKELERQKSIDQNK